jgi:hypothetical protein
MHITIGGNLIDYPYKLTTRTADMVSAKVILLQAGILANKLLCERLARHGYFEQPHTPGLWKHVSRPIWFNLSVDDFGVKYIGDDNLKHLFAALRKETYDIVEDWTGNLYCGISLHWHYNK